LCTIGHGWLDHLHLKESSVADPGSDSRSEPGLSDTGLSDTVRWDVTEAVATIVLNRPRAHNALTAEMKTALLAALREAAASPEVRAVLITGAGPAFCAGQDLREHAGLLAEAQASAAASSGQPAGSAMDTVRMGKKEKKNQKEEQENNNI